MAEITWTAEAQRWLEDIFEYIAADNPQAAAQTVPFFYLFFLPLRSHTNVE
jgi:plasmid stabilization system protein ParE